ncbi:formate nitrite transporter family protein [Babesia ovata]|uniref:Formate-nitrite transporter n=1 Tax=Babesia ovata TaxID=189622 RepID=A0A2H6KI40_9APIC|nr:formate nitrite transporter family protein [Babesia ovata]GBE62653.1 formate nitrite transporter family protein [Babesia ovata]
MEYVCQVRKPAETLEVAVAGGEAKVTCPVYVLFLKAVMGGFFAALGGHAAFVLASYFYAEQQVGASKVAFGLIFTSALVCIIFTGTDLVTSNCMTFALLVYTRKVSALDYVIRMTTSLVGNYSGATIGAAMLSAGTGFFMEGVGSGSKYMKAVYDAKVALPFWRVIFSAIGCNCYVCMAVWCSYAALDSAGTVLAIVLLIASFAVAGYEHIVANFYTLHAALMSCKDTSFVSVYAYNFVPTLIGNYIAGSFVIGLPLFILYAPKREAVVIESQAETNV